MDNKDWVKAKYDRELFNTALDIVKDIEDHHLPKNALKDVWTIVEKIYELRD